MRLTSRQKRNRSGRQGQAPRIAISQAEINADLDYPRSRRPAPAVEASGQRRR